MKKFLIITAMMVLLFPNVLSALNEKTASEPQIAQVIAAKADIFLEASQHSIVIDTIPRGTTVTLFPSGKKNKKWLYISYLSKKRGSQVTGFVDSQRVEIVREILPDKPEGPEETVEPIPEKENSAPEEKKTQEAGKELEDLGDLLNKIEQEKTPSVKDKTVDDVVQQEHSEKEPETSKTEETESGEKAEEREDETQEIEKTETESETPADEEARVEEARDTEVEELPKVLTKVAVKVPRANIRLMPTTKSPIIQQVISGVELKHVAKIAKWHRVNLAPNKEGIVLSGYIHNNIVDEILESVVPPKPEPEKVPEIEPGVNEEETEPVLESEPVQEVPILKKSSIGEYFWVGGGAGYTMPSESHFGKGLNFSGTFGMGVMKHLAVELRVPYFQTEVRGTDGGFSSGRLSSLSLMLSIQGRYTIRNRYVPYVVAGGDYHLNRFSLNEEITQSWNDLGYSIQEKVDHTFGFHFGLGLDVFLLQNIVINMDVRYYTANLSGSRTLAHQISQETSSGTVNSMKLNSIQAGLSVKLFLDPKNKK